nr:MAG TPA: cysteine-rich protein [Bacteriophage sp.]DAH34608.1 MAG TPA: cysteine-rich protein [Bacteriophage sp.]
MIKTINGQTWFCCPKCGKKIHPIKPGACGVLVKCTGKNNGKRCDWYGEIKWAG